MLDIYLSNGEYSPFSSGGNDNNAVGTMAAWKGPVLSEKLSYSTITEYNEALSSFESMR